MCIRDRARMILCPKWHGRVILGTTRAIGEGTVEKGHPKVHQWNYCLGDSDFHMSVGYKAENSMETVAHQAGDWSFILAGADHDLVADPGREAVSYTHLAFRSNQIAYGAAKSVLFILVLLVVSFGQMKLTSRNEVTM